MKTEKAILIKTFKTKRADGHAIRTIYGMTKTGVIQIERRIISKELNDGFILIRKVFGMYYQYERIVFKYDSFATIAIDIMNNSKFIKPENIIRKDDTICNPNEIFRLKIIQ